uniref:F-box domain-containing protein n=1 Tax=Pithovirus LCPAC401 TaxID=2506595 RepID=A0A481Z9W5_9VIRU|nr:MAG: uncharacterized protein LCPAC401_00540 [Pithovirus LCPAC401]
MSDITAILRKLRLTRNNISDLSSDEIDHIFTNISVREIATLCGISSKFNNICKRESLWRSKILCNYGISEPLRGKTWRDSARLFSISNMIDMGKEWVNGMTYKELLEEADNRGSESLLYLNHLKNKYFDDIGFEYSTSWFYLSEDIINEELWHEDIKDISEEDLIKVSNVLTKEFGIISAAIGVRYYRYPDLPYTGLIGDEKYPTNATYTGNVRKSTKAIDIMIDEMFDYMPYIMNFSSSKYNELVSIIQGMIYPPMDI